MSRAAPVVIFLLSVLLGSCAGGARGIPEPRPLGREIPAYRAEDPSRDGSPPAPSPAPRGDLALRDVLAAALLGNPGLSSASWETRAAEARTLQASLYPNPELEVEVENFAGSGELSGFEAAEWTLSLSQEIPLAGKVGKRTDVARLERRLADWDYEAARLDVLTEATKAFIALVAAQERMRLAEESVRLSEEVAGVVRQLVESGKASAVEAKKATVDLSLERLRLDREKRRLSVARRALSGTWGETRAEFGTAVADLFRVRPVPPVEAVVGWIDDSPELARWNDRIELSRARLRSERAEAWPDVTLTGGVKRIEELDLHALLAGVTIPLPLFDRNQGAVNAAAAEARVALENRREAEVRIEAEFHAAWQALSVAGREARILADSVLPAAQDAFEASREGFRQGKFSYLDVLVAQRTLFETREQWIESLLAYHQAVADLERLIGRSLSRAEPEKEPAAAATKP